MELEALQCVDLAKCRTETGPRVHGAAAVHARRFRLHHAPHTLHINHTSYIGFLIDYPCFKAASQLLMSPLCRRQCSSNWHKKNTQCAPLFSLFFSHCFTPAYQVCCLENSVHVRIPSTDVTAGGGLFFPYTSVLAIAVCLLSVKLRANEFWGRWH